MRDRDIRVALRAKLMLLHKNESDTLFLDELGLCQGVARVDIAVVNGSLNGYEIKSERDTLERLPAQSEIYNKTLNTVTIVASGSHIEKAMLIVPEWWGVMEATAACDGVMLCIVREASSNPMVDAFSLVQLLWRDEVLEILHQRKLDNGLNGKPRRVLWQRLAESYEIEELGFIVRQQLKSRTSWRPDALPASSDD